MTPHQAILLQHEALEWVREYYGSTLQLSPPVLLATKGMPFHYRSRTNDSVIGLNTSLSIEDMLVSVGEEAGHLIHGRENPEVSLAVAFAGTIWNDKSRDEETRRVAMVTFGKLRNLEEFAGRLGGLAFFQYKGGYPEAYSNTMEWTSEGPPRYFDDIQHQDGYTLALQVIRKGTPPLRLRRQLLQCTTLEEAIELTQPYRIESEREKQWKQWGGAKR